MKSINMTHKKKIKWMDDYAKIPTLSASETNLLTHKIVETNWKRIIPMQVIVFVFEIANLQNLRNFSYTNSVSSLYVQYGSLFLISIAFLGIPLICFAFSKRKGFIKTKTWLYRCFWLLIVIGFFPFIYVDLTQKLSISNIVLLLFFLTLFPILRPHEVMALIALENLFVAAVVLYTHTKQYVIGQSLLLGITAVIFAKLSYNTYCRNIITQHRLNSAVQALRESNQQLRDLSETDTLTCLLNRRGLEKKLEVLWPHIIRHHQNVYGIMLDIDYFKEFNDKYGHVAGDECLRRVSAVLQELTKPITDIAARYGGEEFLIIIDNGSWGDAQNLARLIHQRIEELQIPSATDKVSPYVTVSAGVFGMKPKATDNYSRLLVNADKALYCAKNSGRNCVVANTDLYNK